MTKKRLRVTRTLAWPPSQTVHASSVVSNLDFDATYTYDSEGRQTAVQYPQSGPNLGYTYDAMSRLQKLTDLGASSDIITNATYNAAGQLVSYTGNGGAPSETRYYNSLGQMKQLTSGSLNLKYHYPASGNNRQDQ